LFIAEVIRRYMKIVKKIEHNYKKGKVYNLADGCQIPREEYAKYFENTNEDILTEDGEWCAEDRCKKTVKVITILYAD